MWFLSSLSRCDKTQMITVACLHTLVSLSHYLIARKFMTWATELLHCHGRTSVSDGTELPSDVQDWKPQAIQYEFFMQSKFLNELWQSNVNGSLYMVMFKIWWWKMNIGENDKIIYCLRAINNIQQNIRVLKLQKEMLNMHIARYVWRPSLIWYNANL